MSGWENPQSIECLPVLQNALNSVLVQVCNNPLEEFPEDNEVTEEGSSVGSRVQKSFKDDSKISI